MDVKKILEDYKNGEIQLSHAMDMLKKLPFEDVGYSKIDHHRRIRSGYPEVIFGLGKTPEQVNGIVRHILAAGDEDVLITKATPEMYELLLDIEGINYYDDCKVIHIGRKDITFTKDYVAVISGGTGDIPVCHEAAYTLKAMGVSCKEIYDVGVSGIHRLLAFSDELQNARTVIAAAGMEGALPTVVAGLTDCPVIAVPTSIGYGVSFNGVSALLTMLNSCANRVSVVNIDNGYGAACVAASIVGKSK